MYVDMYEYIYLQGAGLLLYIVVSAELWESCYATNNNIYNTNKRANHVFYADASENSSNVIEFQPLVPTANGMELHKSIYFMRHSLAKSDGFKFTLGSQTKILYDASKLTRIYTVSKYTLTYSTPNNTWLWRLSNKL